MKKEILFFSFFIFCHSVFSQERTHTTNQVQSLNLVPAQKKLSQSNKVMIREEGDKRIIQSNGIPEHLVGTFPNSGNPNAIEEQRINISLPLHPKLADSITPIQQERGPQNAFGIAVNGILFDPGTAEIWGHRGSGWNYEALSGAVPLGVDENQAHVQPGGLYHYHGVPHALFKDLGVSADKESPIIGWAADGFPIYAPYLKDKNSVQVKEMKSSYRLKEGSRPSENGPGGSYDGTFTQDYEYIYGIGDLDECNGTKVVTKDFPEGSYAYFITNNWPVVPRCHRGSPVNLKQGEARGNHHHGGPSQQHRRPPPRGKGRGFPPPRNN